MHNRKRYIYLIFLICDIFEISITFCFKMLSYELQLNQPTLSIFDSIFNFYFHDF